MRTRTRTTTLVIATAAIMAIASIAFGAPGGVPGPPDRGEPMAGTTCSRPDLPWYESDQVIWDEDFEFTLNRDLPGVCFDVITTLAGAWYVTVTPIGRGAKALTIVPRDAVAPGDSCGGVGLRDDDLYEAPIPLPYPGDPRGFTEIPVATVNACLGNADPLSEYQGEFAERVELSDGTDEIMFGPADPPIQHPLAFLVFSTGLNRPGAGVTICVDLPPTEFSDGAYVLPEVCF